MTVSRRWIGEIVTLVFLITRWINLTKNIVWKTDEFTCFRSILLNLGIYATVTVSQASYFLEELWIGCDRRDRYLELILILYVLDEVLVIKQRILRIFCFRFLIYLFCIWYLWVSLNTSRLCTTLTGMWRCCDTSEKGRFWFFSSGRIHKLDLQVASIVLTSLRLWLITERLG